jgi:type II secretory pathway pseudopilin PulG
MEPAQRRAFSLFEAIIVVVLIGIAAVIAVPRLNFSAIPRQKADSAARKVVASLRRIRRLAISDAATNSSGYSLNIIGSSPYGYEIKNLDGGTTLETHTFDPEITCAGGTMFEFGPLGNLEPGSDSQLTVSAEGKTITISITPATGAVKCVEN